MSKLTLRGLLDRKAERTYCDPPKDYNYLLAMRGTIEKGLTFQQHKH
jgi:hypothetical protein